MKIEYKKIKGPKGMPIIGNIHQVKYSNLHKDLEKWALEYGEVFKVNLAALDIYVVSKPNIIQQILKARPNSFRRMSKMDKILKEQGVHGVFNAEGEVWKVHRRIINKGLDLKQQQLYFPSMVVSLERLFHKMLGNIQKEYTIIDDLTRFTVDVTTSLAFGLDMNTLEQKGGVIQEHMEKIFPMIFKRINDPLPLYKIIKSKKDKEFDIAMTEIVKKVDFFIDEARKRIEANPELKENPSNFIEAILIASMEENKFSDIEIKGNLLTLMLAGEDTTAQSLAWVIYFLCKHPAIQDKIYEECKSVLGEEAFLKDYSKNNSFPYIENVINESMRLKSVAPLQFFDALEEVVIDDYLLEKGSKICTLNRAGALTDDYFTDSKTFNPDRWSAFSKCPVHKEEAFMPFGFGPRFCPGKNLAILEMKMVLSMVLKNFQLEFVTPQEEVEEIMAFAMMPSKFKIKLSKRD